MLGRPVTLLEGPAEVIGLAMGASVAGVAPVVAALGAGALGALDDLVGDPSSKGLRGTCGQPVRGASPRGS